MAGFKEYQMLFQLNASMGSGFTSTFQSGQNSIMQMQDKINALNRSQGDISAYQKQQAAIDKTKAKIDLYTQQLQNLQGATATTSKEEAELANAIAAKEKQLTDANSKLDQQTAAATEMGNALRQAGIDTNDLANESARLKAEAAEVAAAQKAEADAAEEAGESMRDAMEGARAALEAAGVITALKQIYGAVMDCSSAAAEFETAMAGVKRTVGGSDGFLYDMGESFKQMSTTMPITATELAGIATTAGQLGIAQSNVQNFTTVMAQLATTTDLSADNAATMLAQFSNITGVTEYDRLGSTVASLGDATATTASKVVEMSQGMAAAASIAGMTPTDILAISAAVGSLGIEAASGSTSMSTLISTLYKATETGDKLEDFASVAGMTGAEFKQAWGTDAVGALDAFIQGLNDTERNGKSAVVILDELGINNVRQTKAILGLAQAGDLLSNVVSQANAAWDENTALGEKASVMYETTEAKMTMMQNAANNVKIAIGDALNPAIGGMYEAATDLMVPFAEWIEANPAIVTGITAFIGALGLATAGIVGYTSVTKLAAAASALFAGSIPGMPVILGIAGAVGLLAAGITALTGASRESAESFDDMDTAYDNMIEQAAKQQEILNLVDSYQDLNDEVKNLDKLMSKDFSTEITITPRGPGDEGKLSPEDFVDETTVRLNGVTGQTLAANDFLEGASATVRLTPEQARYIAANDFVQDGNLTVHLTPEQAKTLTSASFLRETKVKLTPEQQKYLKSDDFIDGEKVIELTATQVQTLAAAGFLTDTTVDLHGNALKELAAAGFLADETVTLTGKAAASLKASDFMLGYTVSITGEAGNTLSAADFGLSDQTLTYIASLDDASVESVTQQAKSLQSEIASVDSQIASTQTELGKAQEAAGILAEKISGTKNTKTKNALKEQLEEVNTTIEEQQTKLDELTIRHTQLSSQYSIVGTAAQELQGKEEQLMAVKLALAGASDLVTDASGQTAAAFDAEAAAAQRDAEAQLAAIRSQLYDNITRQTASYSNAVEQAATATSEYNRLAARQTIANSLQGKSTEEVNAAYLSMLRTMDQMEAAEGWSPDNADYQQAVSQAEAWISLMRGTDVSGLQQTADDLNGGVINWEKSFGSATVSASEWNNTLAHLNEDIVTYKTQMDEADSTHNAFIENLVNGVTSGAVELEEVEARITDAVGTEEGAADTVSAIMAEVTAGVNAAAEAKEAYAEASEEMSDSSEAEVTSVESIIASLKDLQTAYKEAYDNAYTSMSGQFKLFEGAADKIKQMNQGSKGGVSGMTQSLEQQQQYIEQYGQNYALVAHNMEQAGVSSETANTILNNLSDGSVESAQYLQSLSTASAEELTALATAYEGLQGTKEEYASTVAEIQTNFSETMNQLQSDLAGAIAGMEMSGEAAANAKATLDAYVNAADGYVALASMKYGAVASAAVAALRRAFGLGGFATGTRNAPRGLAWVGEEGPELMWFNGGERVMNHDESERYAQQNFRADNVTPIQAESVRDSGSRGQYNIDYSPVYQFNGGMNAEDVRSVLEDHSRNMRDEIESILADIEEDGERRRLA